MKKTVAVFFGGRSTEHDISIITALSSVIKPLELTKKYSVIPVYISKTGVWFSDNKLKDVKLYRSKAIDEFCARAKPVSVVFDGGMLIKKAGSRGKGVRIDVAFPALHGLHGEDGSMMGLLRMAGIPFVGADMSASVIAMDKVIAKQIAQANDIPTSKFVFFNKTDFINDSDEVLKNITNNLKYPLFVKPAHLGSSIGISRVTNSSELFNAIEVAAYYDSKIIVEQEVGNLIEVTVPIIGNADNIKPSLPERPLSRDGEFFDFDTKYMNGGKKNGGSKQSGSQGYSELPAKLPGGMYDKVLKTAMSVYSATGCEGISRVDLLIDTKSNTVYFNEINPMPGSLYAHNWRANGMSSIELVDELIGLAEARFNRDNKIYTSFSSNFLKQF